MSHAHHLLVLAGAVAIAATGCGSQVVPGKNGLGSESVYRLQAPMERSLALTDKVNRYRFETYGRPMDVAHRNVLYTAAVRHAIHLQTINSAFYDPKSPDSSQDANLITPNSGREDLQLEYAPQEGMIYPALYTDPNPFLRVDRVVGSPDILDGDRTLVFEDYVFSGNIWQTTGATSVFRGFDQDAASGIFDEIDNLWYTRRGRMMLMRPTLQSIGYGAVRDFDIVPPWPILNGRFLGVFMAVVSRPLTAQLGMWPGPGTSGVNPYGLDTDLRGPNQYAGPPIHITLPVAEPFLRTGGIATCEFRRADGIEPNLPSAAWREYQVHANVLGLTVPVTWVPGVYPTGSGEYHARGNVAPTVADAAVTTVTHIAHTTTADTYRFTLDAASNLAEITPGDAIIITISNGDSPGTYSYTVVAVDITAGTVDCTIPTPPSPSFPSSKYGNDVTNLKINLVKRTATGITAYLDSDLRDGELLIVPVAPLERNARYEVRLRLKTASYDTGPLEWIFTTSGN
jgi:hypothetical protein